LNTDEVWVALVPIKKGHSVQLFSLEDAVKNKYIPPPLSIKPREDPRSSTGGCWQFTGEGADTTPRRFTEIAPLTNTEGVTVIFRNLLSQKALAEKNAEKWRQGIRSV
jgi:hypothetical protein